MKLKMLLSIAIFLLIFLGVYPSDNQFLKLKKVAVSSLPEDLIIPDLKSVSVDSKGSVFAFAGKVHGNECFIIKFDENLKYLKRFGRDGKGPGEFSTRANSPENRLSVDTNGDIYVVDYNPRRLIVFDNEGKYKSDINVGRDYIKFFGKIHNVKIVGNGIFVALQFRWNLPTQGLIFTLNPPKLKVEYPFIEKKIYMDWAMTFDIDCCGENCLVATDSQHIVFGNSQIYKFQIYDENGNLKSQLEDKERVMRSFSDIELDYIKKNHLMPQNGYSALRNNILAQFNADKSRFNKVVREIKTSKNVIADIKISGGRIYVFPVRKDITIDGKYPVEIYNLKGQMVKKGYLRERPAKIWKNYVFFYDRDEEDDPLILKYKILYHY